MDQEHQHPLGNEFKCRFSGPGDRAQGGCCNPGNPEDYDAGQSLFHSLHSGYFPCPLKGGKGRYILTLLH